MPSTTAPPEPAENRPDSHRRIGVVSGRYPASNFESYTNHKAYCDRHGYTYIYCNWPTGASNRYMNKIEYVRAYDHLFDYLLWIDDDAFFIGIEQGLEDFLPKPGDFLSVCGSPDFKAIHTYISSGQFILRCNETGRAFVDAVSEVDLDGVRNWWTKDLGYFSNGDQDAMVYLLKQDPRFAGYKRYEYTSFNSRVENLLGGDPVFIVHFTGTVPVKMENYLRVQKVLGRGPSLLTAADEEKLRLIKTHKPNVKRLFKSLKRRWSGM